MDSSPALIRSTQSEPPICARPMSPQGHPLEAPAILSCENAKFVASGIFKTPVVRKIGTSHRPKHQITVCGEAELPETRSRTLPARTPSALALQIALPPGSHPTQTRQACAYAGTRYVNFSIGPRPFHELTATAFYRDY